MHHGMDDHVSEHVRIQGNDLEQVNSCRQFRSGTFMVEGQRTFIAFDLTVGETIVSVAA